MNRVSLANCIRHFTDDCVNRFPGVVDGVTSEPEAVARHLLPSFSTALAAAAVAVEDVRRTVRQEACLHLEAVFDATGLPDTPDVWTPVPALAATRRAMLAVVLVNALAGMETVAYGSENAGAVYVNLVPLPGTGRQPEKSTKNMRGHTDAASFPFRGTFDPVNKRIAPSPDVVHLAALRNDRAVPTIVMRLDRVLSHVSPADQAILKGPTMVIAAQQSFALGTEKALGAEHLVDGTNVLHDGPEGTWIRYTHSGTTVFEAEAEGGADPAAVQRAKDAFQAAVAKCAEEIVVKAGDLLVVNNRKALHGRAKIDEPVGGTSRWLMRSYGLDCGGLLRNQRHGGAARLLYP